MSTGSSRLPGTLERIASEPAAAAPAGAPAAAGGAADERLREMLHFAFGNRKLVFGLGIVLFMLLFAVVGPYLAQHPALEYGGKLSWAPTTRDGYWFGTTLLGQDVFAQFATGVRLAFIVGALGGGIAAIVGMLVGFTAGYRSGIVDEILNMLTNVVLVIPTFAVLLVIAAYLKVRGIMTESLFIGLTSWPWAARALRAQTFSLVSRDFVDMARLSGRNSLQDHVQGDRPQHEQLPVHDVHPPLRRLDPDRRHPRLHRPRPLQHHLAGDDDAALRPKRRPPAAPVVVVPATRPRHHGHRRLPLRHERRPRRSLQPQAERAA